MSFNLLPVLLHSASASIMIWGYNQLSTLPNEPIIHAQVGGHFQYLTIQGLTAACMTMLLGLSGDLLPSLKGFRRTQRFLMMMSLPTCIVVSLIYWSLLSIDPAIILPLAPSSEASTSAAPALMWIPLYLDLTLHAFPALALLIDFMTLQEKYSPDEVNYSATIMAILTGIWYGSWSEYCASYNETFPYPFLTENPLNIRIAIYIGATTVALVCFRFVNFLHSKRRI